MISRELKDAVYLATGIVAVQKNADPDPLTISGFVEWIGEFISDLHTETAAEREAMAAAAAEYFRRNPPPRSEFMIPLYISGAMLYLGQLLDGYAARITGITGPITAERLTALYESTLNHWYVSGVGPSRNMVARESDFVAGIAGNFNRFAYNHYGPELMNTAQGLLDAGSVDAIADAISDASYFNVYASNAMTVTRSMASAEQFQRAGYQDLEYSNPLDEKTTDFCWMIAGKRVRIAKAIEQGRALAQASSMSEFKELAPYVQKQGDNYFMNGTQITEQNAGDVMAEADALLPPFHPRCRTLLIPV